MIYRGFIGSIALAAAIGLTVADAVIILGSVDIVLGVMPSHHARAIYTAMLPDLAPSTILVSATKGLEQGSLLRMSEGFTSSMLRQSAQASEWLCLNVSIASGMESLA